MYNLNPKVVYDLHSTHPKMWLINVVLVYLNDKLCLLVTSPHRAAGKRVKMWRIACTWVGVSIPGVLPTRLCYCLPRVAMLHACAAACWPLSTHRSGRSMQQRSTMLER